MAKIFRPSTREASILSKIESSKEHGRRMAINSLRDHHEVLANAISMKLVEENLVETTNKNAVEEQIDKCLDRMTRIDEFDVDYAIAPIRNLVPNPHVVSIYVTAFVLEKLINHRDVIDIFGSDEQIYTSIHQQVKKILPC